jgi:hypothetical protein
MGIQWNKGSPPAMPESTRLLVIGTPHDGHFGNLSKPEIFVGHYVAVQKQFFPLRIWGMSSSDTPHPIKVSYWAEFEPPEGVELRFPILD